MCYHSLHKITQNLFSSDFDWPLNSSGDGDENSSDDDDDYSLSDQEGSDSGGDPVCNPFV